MALKPDPHENIPQIYELLYETFRPQGWWPLVELQGKKSKKGNLSAGYHPADYSFPRNRFQQYEICLGAILTQNTSWTQVAKTLKDLHIKNLLDVSIIKNMPDHELGLLLRSTGYYHQKAKKIKKFSEFFSELNGKKPDRKELLGIWGIGPETADSMLLYAFKEAFFVIDAYTRRIFGRIFNREIHDYYELQSLFHSSFSNIGNTEKVNIFNEFHSLLVFFAKEVCRKNPFCYNCIIKELCGFNMSEKKYQKKNEKIFD